MRRAEWILGILLVVLLVAVVVLSLIFWFQPEGTANTAVTNNTAVIEPTSIYKEYTAMTAFALSEREAKAWQSDAQLLNATATWTQGADRNDLSSGNQTWNFTYYSASQAAISTLTVLEDKPSFLSEKGVARTLSPATASGWRTDSSEAVRIFLADGGDAFLTNQGISTLIMTLTTDNANGRIEWFLSLFANESGNALTMRIDATSGEILEKLEAP
jgi:hypothetical protein